MNNDMGSVSKAANELPACLECRRRKLRCSREVPTCKECRRLCKWISFGVNSLLCCARTATSRVLRPETVGQMVIVQNEGDALSTAHR